MGKNAAAVLGEAIRAAAGNAPANDRELLRRFADAGDEAAFAALFRRHGGMVLGVCRRALPNLQDAEDACQATFLLLARKAGSERWQPSAANWLYLTARRVSRNARVVARRRTRREERAAVPEAVLPVDRMTGRELLEALDSELDRLPSSYREPLVLCYLEGLTRDEAAVRLGLRPATLKSRLERGRKRLGAALARRGCVAGAGLLALAVTSTAEASPPRLAEGVLAAAAGRVSAHVAALAERAAASGARKSVAALLLLAGSATLGLGWVSTSFSARGAPHRPQEHAERSRDGGMPAPEAKAADKAGQVVRPAARTVAGRVVGPDGKPVAGARLFVLASKTDWLSFDDTQIRPVGTSGADGRFAAAVTPPRENYQQSYLVAYAPGFGIDWLQFGGPGDPEPVGEQTLRLPKDVPISGRVVTTEGRPVSGIAVTAVTVYAPADGKLDDYLARWVKTPRTSTRKYLYVPLNCVTGATTTGPDGRFTLRGAGADRVVDLLIAGSGIARAMPWVVTRSGFDPGPYNEQARQWMRATRPLSRTTDLHAPDFTFVAEPGREISGVVSDSDTGAPLPGCRVFTAIGAGNGVVGVTDAGGRYRLVGIPKTASEMRVVVEPPPGTGYLARSAVAADTGGIGPVSLDVRVARGAVVTVRVVDRQTGKGLRAAVWFAPLPDNKFFGSRPEYSAYARDGSAQILTDDDGRIRLATIPGPILVLASVKQGESYAGEYLCPYRSATPDPDHKGLFRRERDIWVVATAAGTEYLRLQHAVKVVDARASGQTAVELVADRGVTGKILVQDAECRPLAGAWVAGLTDNWPAAYRMPEATGTVYALDPSTPRTLALYHPGKRLGCTVTIRGDEQEPVVARLAPLARVTGRLLDADGRPAVGLEVNHFQTRDIDRLLYDYASPAGSRSITDRDGRFSLDGVVPGVQFGLQIHKGSEYYDSKPTLPRRRLQSGETYDFGDRTVTPRPAP